MAVYAPAAPPPILRAWAPCAQAPRAKNAKVAKMATTMAINANNKYMCIDPQKICTAHGAGP
jgi:hypothetical protein